MTSATPVAFDFATATRILFGDGRAAEVGDHARALGQRALVVTGSQPERHAGLLDSLRTAGLALHAFPSSGEPDTATAQEAVAQARAHRCDLVIGLGGGSALDLGKAVAMLLTNEGDPLDYLEVIGKGKKITRPSAPFIALPTTAGTGSEVTSNAVLASHEHRVKVSLRSPLMLPRLAIVDPRLTLELPPAVTASTGLDALTQCLEPYVSCKHNPVTDGFAREGMRRAARSLKRVFTDGADLDARRDLALASLFGGLSLANAKLGAAHGFAGPFGGMYDSPHGAVCARLLPLVMEVNVRALRARAPRSEILARYGEVAELLTGRAGAQAEEGVAWVEALTAALEVAPLRTYGLLPAHFDDVVEKSRVSSSMQGNPLVLTREELGEILERAY